MIEYYYSQSKMLGHPTFLLTSDKGLMYVSTDEQDEEQFFKAIKRWFKIDRLQCEYNDEKLKPYVDELQRFELGQPPKQLQMSFDLRGTGFQVKVWQALLTIPFGETTYYGAIARLIGNEKAVRAVGGAIGSNPILLFIPCHRVVGKNGSLTGFRSGLSLKKQLLEHEQKHIRL